VVQLRLTTRATRSGASAVRTGPPFPNNLVRTGSPDDEHCGHDRYVGLSGRTCSIAALAFSASKCAPMPTNHDDRDILDPLCMLQRPANVPARRDRPPVARGSTTLLVINGSAKREWSGRFEPWPSGQTDARVDAIIEAKPIH
jgi:hypothetical protein